MVTPRGGMPRKHYNKYINKPKISYVKVKVKKEKYTTLIQKMLLYDMFEKNLISLIYEFDGVDTQLIRITQPKKSRCSIM